MQRIAILSLALGCHATDASTRGESSGAQTTGEAESTDDEGTSEGGGPSPDSSGSSSGEDTGDDGPAEEPDELPFDPDQLDRLCDRGNGDRVAQALCAGPSIAGLADLRAALGFAQPFVAMTGNSSSLVARYTSALNPRLIVGQIPSSFPPDLHELGAMGFVRGEQFVELVAFDPEADELNFYLLMFEQACNADPDGCGLADLVTPAIEDDWTRWTLYQDIDIVNKTVDCLVCHQPLGPDTPKILRMQELQDPWLHWFPGGIMGTAGAPSPDPSFPTLSGATLMPIFEEMHADEGGYGSVPIEELRFTSSGPSLEAFVTTYLNARPLPPELQLMHTDYFVDAATIERDIFFVGESPTWDALYADVVAGSRLPLPSFRVDITDPAMRTAAVASYHAVRNGEADPSTLLDPREVLSDEVMTQMSLMPRPDAQAPEILHHMCSRCHNGNLDPTLTRARFDATALDLVAPQIKELIADRIVREHDDRWLMPPPRFGTLPDWAIERVLAWTTE
jgi:hypothetical protein